MPAVVKEFQEASSNFVTVHAVVPVPLVFRLPGIQDVPEFGKAGLPPCVDWRLKFPISHLARTTCCSEGQSLTESACSMISGETPLFSSSFARATDGSLVADKIAGVSRVVEKPLLQQRIDGFFRNFSNPFRSRSWETV
jgi:hypothetical protein